MPILAFEDAKDEIGIKLSVRFHFQWALETEEAGRGNVQVAKIALLHSWSNQWLEFWQCNLKWRDDMFSNFDKLRPEIPQEMILKKKMPIIIGISYSWMFPNATRLKYLRLQIFRWQSSSIWSNIPIFWRLQSSNIFIFKCFRK